MTFTRISVVVSYDKMTPGRRNGQFIVASHGRRVDDRDISSSFDKLTFQFNFLADAQGVHKANVCFCGDARLSLKKQQVRHYVVQKTEQDAAVSNSVVAHISRVGSPGRVTSAFAVQVKLHL